MEPIDLEVDLPASIVAEAARPPLTLPDVVCYQGMPHAELDAWRNGVAFKVREPSISATGE
jgi:hypothetical protein